MGLTNWKNSPNEPIYKYDVDIAKNYLTEKELKDLNKDKIKLLASNGMLVKRPMLIDDNFVLNGFKEDLWKELL